MKTITVNIEKGGAGKTTIACHLAWHLADAGHRVLVLDLDRQRNAKNAPLISSDTGPVKVWVIRTDEELMIATSTTCVLNLGSIRKP